MSDPFAARHAVAVAGGELMVARSGPPPREADAVVLAVHGITASHLAWRAVARELSTTDPGVALLAPDLRGRGDSAGLPGPYGIGAHVADLLAVLDDAGVERAVLAGHSMGAYVVARLAAEHRERAASVVLLDGGVPVPLPEGETADTALDNRLGPAIARLNRVFASREEYVEQWRSHPALAGRWNDDVEAYAGYDATGEPGAVRCVVSEEAVRADSADVIDEAAARAALAGITAPVRLLRAPRGFQDEEDKPFIEAGVLEAFAAEHPEVQVAHVAGVNHYTLMLGEGPGPVCVADSIRAALGEEDRRAHPLPAE